MTGICKHCGGPSVCNGSNRMVCKVCGKSFKKSEGSDWKKIKNDIVHGNEHFPNDIDIEQLI